MTPNEDIYERLAAALEALPHGFARTPSGVEIKLMKKAFTEEEVWLAGQLTRTPETAAEIAQAVGPGCGRGHRAAREADSAGSGLACPETRRGAAF